MSGVAVYVARRREIQPSRKASFGRGDRFCSSHAHFKVGELTCAGKWGRSGVGLCPLREDLTHTFQMTTVASECTLYYSNCLC